MSGIDIGFFNILFEKSFLITAISAILAFATIVTFGLPLLERNTLGNRMKAVSERREELRARHHAAPGGTALALDLVVAVFTITVPSTA